ncbi:hypothetical protein ACI3PL_22505, partial [Lacticaseibacillus paracasei]
MDDDLTNKIGKIDYVNDDMVLTVNNDFSFLIPNLFESAPHVKAAYQAHLDVKELITKYIKIHSNEVVELTDKVYDILT